MMHDRRWRHFGILGGGLLFCLLFGVALSVGIWPRLWRHLAPQPNTATLYQAEAGHEALRSKIDGADPDVARAAIYALAERWEQGTPELVFTLARDADHPEVQRAAVYVLAENGGAEALPWLADLLKDAEAPLRKTVVHALGESHGDAAVRILEAVVQDDASLEVRKAAVYALGEIGTPAARAALRGLVAAHVRHRPR